MNSAIIQELMQHSPGKTVCLLGNHAIVRGGLEAGVQFVSCYPGTPASEIGDTFARIHHAAGVMFEYSVNEKIAVEIAFAASLTGARSLCSMKHLGLSYAGDPIATMPYVGVQGGMVIVSAGDPSAITSPNEQDQRHFNRFLFYPVFDPATPADALRMTRYAFEFSEQCRLPVIMRPTTRVCHTSGMVELGPLPEAKNTIAFVKNPPQYVPAPVNARRMRKELQERLASAERLLSRSDFFPRTGTGKCGIIASGVAYVYAAQVIQDLNLRDQISLLQIGAYPIPENILVDFIHSIDSVLVVEELTPFVEDWLTLTAYRNRRLIPIYGKHSGHFPPAFEYDPDLVEDAVRNYLGMEERCRKTVNVPELPPRPPVLCAGCPHRASFYYARRVFGKKTVYVNDIGCYTLGYGKPLDAADVLLNMGASISMASGIARSTGERVVAYIGDSTFFHSGMPALVNAVAAKDAITVCILNNFITAMTGLQPSAACAYGRIPAPGTDQTSMGRALKRAVLGLGVHDVYSIDPFDEDAALDAFRKAKSGSGVNVIICNSPCVVYANKTNAWKNRAPFTVNQEQCNGCSLCVRVLGCPAVYIEDGKYFIDQAMCTGCALCAAVCQHDAIHRVESNVA